MNSGYAGYDFHRHPFLDQDCSSSSPSSLFSISNTQKPDPLSPNLHLLRHQRHHQQVFHQSQSVPITHELFQHQHQFQAFQHQHHQQQQQQQQQQQLEHESVHAPHLCFPVNFKLGLNENSCKRDGAEDLNHCWENQAHSSIKEPFWKPLSEEIDCNNDQRCNEIEEQQMEGEKNKKQINEDERLKDMECKYRLFGELEAIYSLSKIFKTNQTGSGSALTGETSPTNAALPVPSSRHNVGALGVDHGSETSIGQEASLREIRKKKRKRKMKDQLSSMAGFFESLVKQVMEHQEGLHMKFLEVIEKMDKRRKEREEEWKCHETEKHKTEAIARANEQAQASSREKLILSYIEKITGQSFNLSAKPTSLTAMKFDRNCRWPKAEVEALVEARSSLESKFQETGMKGQLWEEISSLMGAKGYQRNAKGCKEKWEKINKYFRKTKESGKSKTCSYFDELDMLYSKTTLINGDVHPERQGYVELLEAITSGKTLGVSEMGNSKLDFDREDEDVDENDDCGEGGGD